LVVYVWCFAWLGWCFCSHFLGWEKCDRFLGFIFRPSCFGNGGRLCGGGDSVAEEKVFEAVVAVECNQNGFWGRTLRHATWIEFPATRLKTS
jgi:hypothetical protein